MKITCQIEKWHQHFINKNGFLEPKKNAKDERFDDLELFIQKKKEIGGIIYKIGLRKTIWKMGFGKNYF